MFSLIVSSNAPRDQVIVDLIFPNMSTQCHNELNKMIKLRPNINIITFF